MPRLYRIENINNNLKIKKPSSESRSSYPEKKKLCFKDCKKNTINSLNEVEYFLRNFKQAFKYIKLYKILK